MAAFLITVAVLSGLLLLGVLIGLVRRLRDLSRSLAIAQRDLEPLVEGLREDTEEAQRRAARLQDRAAAVKRS